MALPADHYPDRRDALYRGLMARAAGLPNDATLAALYATWASGGGALPDWLGLTPPAFRRLLERHFPGLIPAPVHPGALDLVRAAERTELVGLMLQHRAGACASEADLAAIVAAACMAGDHLWQDLGLWSRRQLSDLMGRSFPSLAAKNVKDMKWKKFLYKQLCAAEGIYLCRAPSCEVCVDYAACFGHGD
jgi:nitrogen fixation protein NifQ